MTGEGVAGMREPPLPAREFVGGHGLEKQRVRERAEHALKASGNTWSARSGRSEGNEAGQGLAGFGDGDFLAGFDPGEELGKLRFGLMDVDDRRRFHG